MSSLVLLSASIGNGGVSDSDNTRIALARTSILPVASLSFTAPERAVTSPVTATTNSLRSFSAFANPSLPISLSSKINRKMPERSLRSTNIMPPLFLCFCTHPITVTVSPIFCSLSSAQRHVRFKPFIDSAIVPPISAAGIPFLHGNSNFRFLSYNKSLYLSSACLLRSIISSTREI